MKAPQTRLSEPLWLASIAGLVLGAAQAMAQTCPELPEASLTGSKVPVDVCIPAGSTGLPIDYFDDYSWKLFLSLIWPSTYGGRGMADEQRTWSASGTRVFETFKPAWEIFHRDGSPPASPDFQQYEAPSQNACRVPAGFGDLVLGSDSGIQDLGQNGAGALLGPLVAQNRTWVRYLTSYNEIAFRQIEKNQWYRRKFLPAVSAATFPDGALAVRSAWIETEGLTPAQKSRIYIRMATVKDPHSGKCRIAPVGLIGINIAQKTPSRPQWIWSSFEQVDLVPPAEPDGPGRFLLNDGRGSPMPPSNPRSLIPLASAEPFNVERSPKAPIHPQTQATNQKYRSLMAGSIWQNYRLVVTQWTDLRKQQLPGDGRASVAANVALETFQQTQPDQSCMNCHSQARSEGDFIWSLSMHAFPEQILLPKVAEKHKSPGQK